MVYVLFNHLTEEGMMKDMGCHLFICIYKSTVGLYYVET